MATRKLPLVARLSDQARQFINRTSVSSTFYNAPASR